MREALKYKFLIALFVAIILALLTSCYAPHQALPLENIPQDTMVVKFVYDGGSHTARIALAGPPATHRSIKAHIRARERQKQEVLAEWLKNGIPKDIIQPALPEPVINWGWQWDTPDEGPATDWGWAWNVSESDARPATANVIDSYYWRRSVPAAYEGFPVVQHSFSQCSGLSDAGLYLILSEKYGPFFLKVKRFYRPGGSRFVVWQPAAGIKPDNLAHFEDMTWLATDNFQIFKIQAE